MADQCPNKNDIQLVFKRLRSISTNKACFDCSAKNPTWASVTYGVFICIDCSAVHRSLGVHVTFVRSTQLDTNWTWLQLRQMQLGGNANATTFFRQHNCTTTDAQQKYNSRAAQLYKEKIHQLAIQAMRLHGTKLDLGSLQETAFPKRLHLESHSEPVPSPEVEKRDDDFFEEHSSAVITKEESVLDEDSLSSNLMKAHSNGSAILAGRGEPNVDAALSGYVEPSVDRKPTIGVRKPQSKRTGLTGKKGGLGAQKVKANFADIEREAALADQLRVQAAEEAKQTAQRTAEEEQNQIASVRLAYQDLGIQQRKQEEQLRRTDPVKAQQVERLGMGVSSRMGVSHSALSDMKVIEQESPSKLGGGGKSLFDRDSDSLFKDDFHFISPSYSMYKSPSDSKGVESLFLDSSSNHDRYSNNNAWNSEPERSQPLPGTTLEDRSPSSHEAVIPASSNGEAQKKFGSAKAISSDQYFGDSSDNTWERRANLSRFEGSSSISSADYFGTGSNSMNRGAGSASLHTPDLEEVKESVRQGVTKVAGKLSSIASGVMSSIQDRYGY